MNDNATKVKTRIDGEEAISVFFTKSIDNSGASPADKLAAVEYSIDNTVQRNLMGNISASITGTVA